jgi:hypothetical protein
VKVGVVMRWRLLILEVALPGWGFVEYLGSRLRGDKLQIFVYAVLMSIEALME